MWTIPGPFLIRTKPAACLRMEHFWPPEKSLLFRGFQWFARTERAQGKRGAKPQACNSSKGTREDSDRRTPHLTRGQALRARVLGHCNWTEDQCRKHARVRVWNVMGRGLTQDFWNSLNIPPSQCQLNANDFFLFSLNYSTDHTKQYVGGIHYENSENGIPSQILKPNKLK